MDWPSLLAGLALGILGNLLTPSVRLALINSSRWAGSRVNRLSEKGLRLRLDQLKNDYSYVIDLKNNPAELIGLVMQSVMPVLFVTWLIIVIVFFISSSGASGLGIPNALYGAIGCLVGLGIRWVINAMIAWGFVNKVRKFDNFEKNNISNRQQIETLLNQSSSKG